MQKQAAIPSVMDLEQITTTAPRIFHIRMDFRPLRWYTGEVRVPVKLTVMGEHNVMNALAALAVADAYGVPLADAAEKLLEFGGFKNRQQIYHKNGYTIVDDTYNASPDSMKAAIGVLSSRRQDAELRFWQI